MRICWHRQFGASGIVVVFVFVVGLFGEVRVTQIFVSGFDENFILVNTMYISSQTTAFVYDYRRAVSDGGVGFEL